MPVLQTPNSFSNLQKELLKLYAVNVSDEDLLIIRSMIGNYFAEKATTSLNNFLTDKNISTSEYNNWENEHSRKSSN
ncbi:MAG: hypothetical protein LH615_07070 [Ferruginibacter sp.]|nr:hypothetical protein [Ferruginibacter sp.]